MSGIDVTHLRRQSEVCTQCEGQGWVVRDPYGNALPCSHCGGDGCLSRWVNVSEEIVLLPQSLGEAG